MFYGYMNSVIRISHKHLMIWVKFPRFQVFFYFCIQIDGKKISSIKDLVQEAQPDQEQLEKQQDVAEKLKVFLMVRSQFWR